LYKKINYDQDLTSSFVVEVVVSLVPPSLGPPFERSLGPPFERLSFLPSLVVV